VPAETEKLLKAEEAVRVLVATLTRLQEEVDSYKTAGLALDKVRVDLHDLVTRTADLAGATRTTIDTLGKIGTPELLYQLQLLQAQVGVLHASAETTQADYRRFSELQREHGGKLDALAEKFDNSFVHIEEVVAERLAETIRQVERPIAALRRRQSITTLLIALTFLVVLAILGLSLPSVRGALGLN
jgi:hypothetical protein